MIYKDIYYLVFARTIRRVIACGTATPHHREKNRTYTKWRENLKAHSNHAYVQSVYYLVVAKQFSKIIASEILKSPIILKNLIDTTKLYNTMNV